MLLSLQNVGAKRTTFSTFHGLHLVVIVVLDVTLKHCCQLRVFVVDLVNKLRHLLPLTQAKRNFSSGRFGFRFAIGNEELPEVDTSISRRYRDIDSSADVMSVLYVLTLEHGFDLLVDVVHVCAQFGPSTTSTVDKMRMSQQHKMQKVLTLTIIFGKHVDLAIHRLK